MEATSGRGRREGSDGRNERTAEGKASIGISAVRVISRKPPRRLLDTSSYNARFREQRRARAHDVIDDNAILPIRIRSTLFAFYLCSRWGLRRIFIPKCRHVHHVAKVVVENSTAGPPTGDCSRRRREQRSSSPSCSRCRPGVECTRICGRCKQQCQRWWRSVFCSGRSKC